MNKDILRNGDVISAVVLAALGAYVFMESRNWAYFGEEGPGPAFFPAWYGIAMIVLSLVLIVTTIAKRCAADAYDWPAVGRALGTWVAFALCAALMGWLGFFLSFAILTFFVVMVIYRQSVATAGIVAVGAATGFYAVFPLALGLSLPTGVFGF